MKKVRQANGRFKTGQVIDANTEGLDLYNTMLSGMGAKEKLGPVDRKHENLDAIMA